MAPNSAHVVSLSAFTVRSGSALPSLHQNSHPMSHGTYSASKLIRSRTMRVASITSLPTPSPGIHAILYLAIRRRLYRRTINPQADEFWGAQAAGLLHSAARRMIRDKSVSKVREGGDAFVRPPRRPLPGYAFA